MKYHEIDVPVSVRRRKPMPGSPGGLALSGVQPILAKAPNTNCVQNEKLRRARDGAHREGRITANGSAQTDAGHSAVAALTEIAGKYLVESVAVPVREAAAAVSAPAAEATQQRAVRTGSGGAVSPRNKGVATITPATRNERNTP